MPGASNYGLRLPHKLALYRTLLNDPKQRYPHLSTFIIKAIQTQLETDGLIDDYEHQKIIENINKE